MFWAMFGSSEPRTAEASGAASFSRTRAASFGSKELHCRAMVAVSVLSGIKAIRDPPVLGCKRFVGKFAAPQRFVGSGHLTELDNPARQRD
jgi:hypothetical protein